ncbi:uncharacterized protein EI90DRAFT_2914004 [Cantharellus anzutake]|uniref:uncharacterized protein n=1 Tax=Cantharellus anzutake TaxID=1750568 RepID=UPI00190351C7|nr:uncharacterized protein EI90DRAFT_2914004 [Cantharellus anzutake]KAF8335020.1 hypothetical protein EI90DRAFT_2914004 [Cantharellus anzutake]
MSKAAEAENADTPKPRKDKVAASQLKPKLSKAERREDKQRGTKQEIAPTSSISSDSDVLRDLRIFSHFGTSARITGHSVPSKADIHPAVSRLALQFSSFRVVGANARCIATLSALKTVIQQYHTPSGTTLSRHLPTYLSPQITHLVAARPMSTSMGNAIRYMKYEISILSIDVPEQEAKRFLSERLDAFVRERILLADLVIQSHAIEKIKDGDVVLTFARSSVVEGVLLKAHELGKRFTVIVVDSGPLFEGGKQLLSSLANAGIKSTYCLLSGISTAISGASIAYLGAHSLHANGALYSRAGTALVAMMAKQHSVPVLACCETYKFSNGVPFDGFTKNELVPDLTQEPRPYLQSLNPLYDLTPASMISAVVTEVGLIPPSSIPTLLHREGIPE